MPLRTVLLLGATGVVGRELLDVLLHDAAVERVRVIARRSSGVQSPKLEEHVFDLSEMERHAELFAVDAIFCALGTTIKVAGTVERFRVVDYEYPLIAARLGREQNAQHYLLVSSMGANPRARTFYPRVKGEVERDLLALDYPRTTIARPSFLLGERAELRRVERIVAAMAWAIPRTWKPVEPRKVARALVNAAHGQTERTALLMSREIAAT